MFIPIARADSHQEILSREVTASIPGEVKAEDQYGNLFWRGRVEKSDGKPIHVSATYAVRRHVFKNELIGKVKRTEMTVREKVDHARFLGPNERVPVSGELVTRMAKEIAPGETNPAVVARAIYDYVVDTMEYKKVGKGWGNGDTHWACSERYGNCTDFHALFISLARVRGIPAKFAIGSAVPEGKSEGELGGYHCWVEFYLPDAGWVPIDASEAKKHPEKRELLFGTHPADRFQLSVGRDLKLGAGHHSRPLNYFVHPHVELAGKPYKQVKRVVTFKEGPPPAVTPVAAAPSSVDPAEDSLFTPYGFIRLDAIFDDSRMQHSQYPFWVQSEDPSVGVKDDSRMTLHPRLTRVGVKLNPQSVATDWSMSGRIEIDFQNGGSESRELIRMRHAFMSLQSGAFSFLAGQTWDIVSPLYPAANNDGMMWNAGNLGDRHPQVQLALAPRFGGGQFEAIVGASMTGAVDKKDLDDNGEHDGFAAAIPSAQARLGYSAKLWSGRPLKIAAWGHYGQEETATAVGGETDFNSWAAGFSLSLPLATWLALEGEGWMGENLSDIRGGIGQGVNTGTGAEIASRGGWAQAAIDAAGWWSLFLGATMDDPDDGDLNDGDRSRNAAAFLVNRFKPWSSFQVGVEYLYWLTEYKNLDSGSSNRVDLHFSYFF